MLGATAQAAPRLADATALKNEAAAPDLKAKTSGTGAATMATAMGMNAHGSAATHTTARTGVATTGLTGVVTTVPWGYRHHRWGYDD